jgi:circadian clock protein KaiC
MAHSNQVREFVLSERGVELIDVYAGPAGVLTGTARLAQEARERADARSREQEVARKRREIEQRRAALEAQIAAMRAELEIQEMESMRVVHEDEAQAVEMRRERTEMERARGAGANGREAHGGDA